MDSRSTFSVGSIASQDVLTAIPKLLGGVVFMVGTLLRPKFEEKTDLKRQTILYHTSLAIYNIYFHPLRKFPGPKLYAASRLPYVIAATQGRILRVINDAHERYGDIVRVAPNELSFTTGETAWQEIYGFRGGKKEEFQKDLFWYSRPVNGVRSIISANRQDHSRMRRVFSHAFSDKALRDQEPLIQRYVELLIRRLREKTENGETFDLVKYVSVSSNFMFTDSDPI